MPSSKPCFICKREAARVDAMCSGCARSYDRHIERDDGTLFSALKWAADRVRQMEKRNRPKKKAIGVGTLRNADDRSNSRP
jgi:hypothetical protein